MSQLRRKFVDLIYQTSSNWTNCQDPPRSITVGTYGTIDKETGELQVEGNIYDNSEIQGELEKAGVGLTLANCRPVDGPLVEEKYILASSSFSNANVDVDPQANIEGGGRVAFNIKGTFKDGKRSAILAMYRSRISCLPPDVVLKHLYNIPLLEDKSLVTQVYMCPAYTMHLSKKNGGSVSLQLVARAPAHVPGATVAGGLGLDWQSEVQSDFSQEACGKDSDVSFTPLYTLKHRNRLDMPRFRDYGKPPEGDDLWHDASTPWDPLDEDGEEDTIAVDD